MRIKLIQKMTLKHYALLRAVKVIFRPLLAINKLIYIYTHPVQIKILQLQNHNDNKLVEK